MGKNNTLHQTMSREDFEDENLPESLGQLKSLMQDHDMATNNANAQVTTISGSISPRGEYKVYPVRWLILAIFVLYSASNGMQWIQYSIIANIVQKYYQVDYKSVDWTSMVYMITYIPLIFPASWLLDKKGLRVASIIGATGTCLGSWMKAFSVSPDLFWLGLFGQTIVAMSQTFILSLPSCLAAVWFGPTQVSSACSIGVFGNQLGIAIGFLLPPILVKNHDDVALIGRDLQFMFYLVAGITTVLLFLVIFLFKAAPPTPPSGAQDSQQQQSEENSTAGFVQSVKRLMTNIGYNKLLVSYGINVGVFYALSTLLNQIVLQYYPGREEDAGRIGLTIVLAGMMGSVVCGIVLDKTHKFKETTLALYGFSMVGMVIYTFTLNCGYIAVVYFASGLLGFFMTGYLPVGFEFGAELTYPEPEGTSAGILNAAAQLFGILFTLAYSHLLDLWGDLGANLSLCGMLCLGTAITAIIKSDLRRQHAHSGEKNEKNGIA